MLFGLLKSHVRSFSEMKHTHHYPTSNTAAVCTITPASVQVRIVIHKVFFSLSAAPAAAVFITVEDGSGNIVFKQQVTASGPGVFTMSPRVLTLGNAAIVTIAAAGGSIVATLDVDYTIERE